MIVRTNMRIAVLHELRSLRTILELIGGWGFLQLEKDEDALKVIFHD